MKEGIQGLILLRSQSKKLPRGSIKRFFDSVWSRLHLDANVENDIIQSSPKEKLSTNGYLYAEESHVSSNDDTYEGESDSSKENLHDDTSDSSDESGSERDMHSDSNEDGGNLGSDSESSFGSDSDSSFDSSYEADHGSGGIHKKKNDLNLASSCNGSRSVDL
eukprot:CAMPEP_0195526304 /NCGR_PEP_ID=MMETSP0794_2-20130614/27296_1 /TAXON_ID=515487 /ORGANISM="Stephanopyxis turris, Strain CCMP 815" /LENGTH=162 /DNA_ID=CAMNT_0040656959 /DNA_START=46 /DNA_END=534 /DNA_ORIENTATION=-